MTFKARIASFLPPLLPLILSICIAETAVRMAWVPSYLIPAPSEVFRSLLDDRLDLALAAWETLNSALAGLLLSFGVGTIFSVALSSSDLARRAFYPYAVFFPAVLISSLLGIVLVGAVNLVSSLSLGSWHTSERKSS